MSITTSYTRTLTLIIMTLLILNPVKGQIADSLDSQASKYNSTPDSVTNIKEFDIQEGNTFIIDGFSAGLGINSYSFYHQSNTTLSTSVNFGKFGYCWKSLFGLGIGTAIFEYNKSSKIQFDLQSLFPVYLYFPIYNSSSEHFKVGIREIVFPHIYLFGGGTLWGFKYDYFHFGINATIFSINIKDNSSRSSSSKIVDALFKLGAISFYVQTGMYISSSGNNYLVQENPHKWYINLNIGFGGIYR